MSHILLAPSIERADWLNLERDIRELETADIDMLHIDIMDKTYGETILFSPRIIGPIKAITLLPLDIHMYVRNPEVYFEDLFACLDTSDYINIEVEAVDNLAKLVLLIKDAGCKAAVSVDIATPLCSIQEIASMFDMVNLIIRNAGCPPTELSDAILDKIKRTKIMLREAGNPTALIEVDGSIRFEDVSSLIDAGADVLVLGSKVIFRKGFSFQDGSRELRAITEDKG